MADDPLERARRCAEVMYAADQASRRLGISVGDVAPGRAVARMPVTGAMINGHDICHGGYVFLLADTAFAFACNTYDRVTVAAACDVVFVAPARLGDELVAEAVERLRYGRSGVYDVTVRRDGSRAGTADGGGGEVVAEFRGTARALAEPLLPPDAPEAADQTSRD
ncbi:MAG: hydroxyphenylacetyl-CoA thioesterase PaaI [Carbonactinosporaceae bacterium]